MSHQLFNFSLRELREIAPWGNNRLSWFGLTDGFYYMQVGSQKLFESSSEILNLWKQENPQNGFIQPYVDYPIVRLYEDLLDILPSVLEAIPEQQQKLIASFENEHSWWNSIQTNFEIIDDNNEDWLDAYYKAIDWWSGRHLSTMHLQHSPKIVMWRYEDAISIRWDNTHAVENNIAVWSAVKGQIELSVEEFLSQVNMFHNQFMAEMQLRVQAIKHNNPIPSVNIDIPRLLEEQKEREQSLDNVLNRPYQATDWQKVTECNQTVLKPLN